MTSRTSNAKPSLSSRVRGALLQPDESTPPTTDVTRSVGELAKATRAADDKERLVGLLLAPFAALIGLLINASLVGHDPSATLTDGTVNPAHASVSLYYGVLAALLGLSVLMLVTAWFRRRALLGITMGMYGLTVFNLHYWGFGIPYLLCAGYLLVRSYRLQRELREQAPATEMSSGSSNDSAPRPRANKRYTPGAATGSRA